MDKEVHISLNLDEKGDSKNSTIVLVTTKIHSDVLFALSLAVFLFHRPHHYKDITSAKVINKLMVEQLDDSGGDSNIVYPKFCELFDFAYQTGDVVKSCKEIYSSQISKEGRELIHALNTFIQLISDRLHDSDDEDKMRTVHMQQLSEENESCKEEMVSLVYQIDEMVISYNEKVHEYEEEKERYDEQIENTYREANLNTDQVEMKNKHDMLIYLTYSENRLDEIEKLKEEKQRLFDISKDNNNVETENLKRVLRKEILLKMINTRFSNDMLMRHKKKEAFEQLIETKTNSLEALKENAILMETYLKELEEKEDTYLNQELYNILEKRAFRTISKFLIPYVNMKFGPSRKKKSKKSKIKKKQKIK